MSKLYRGRESLETGAFVRPSATLFIHFCHFSFSDAYCPLNEWLAFSFLKGFLSKEAMSVHKNLPSLRKTCMQLSSLFRANQAWWNLSSKIQAWVGRWPRNNFFHARHCLKTFFFFFFLILFRHSGLFVHALWMWSSFFCQSNFLTEYKEMHSLRR